MVYYAEARERVRVLKEEYDMQFNAWAAAVDGGAARNELVLRFSDLTRSLDALEKAGHELYKITAKREPLPDNMVILTQ